MAIQKGDFIEINFTGKTKEENFVFDTTIESVAKENNINNKNAKYEPAIVCVGENQLIKGLDEDVIGKEINTDYKVKVSAENAFGKKDAKLIQLVPFSKFKKQNIRPVPGLQVQIDGQYGVIKIVTGGRVMVDFNHPLSGKDLVYEYNIKRIVEDDSEKIKSYFKTVFNIDVEPTKTEKGYDINTKQEMPEMVQEQFSKKLKEIVSESLVYTFSSDKKEEKTAEKKD